MRKVILIAAFFLAGCGYTLKGLKSSSSGTIYVPTFRNNILIQKDSPEYRLYYPGLEIELENLLKERFRYDGNILPVSNPEAADLVLEGEILDYEKDPLRYAQNEDIEEYRIKIRTKIKLLKGEEDLWEDEIVGETTYLISGPNAKTETEAVREAVKDLVRRIVDRVVENW